MPHINKVIVAGHLGRDPEMKVLPSGNAVANLSVATSEKWKDKQTGEQKEKTEWHRLTAFGKTAELIGKYLHKGDAALFEGKLQTRKWQDKNGADRYTTEIMVDSVHFLGKGAGRQDEPAPAAAPAQAPAAASAPDDDEDIPF